MDSEMGVVKNDAVTFIVLQINVEESENKTSSGIPAEAQASYFLNASSMLLLYVILSVHCY
jgi:hypothetical protein